MTTLKTHTARFGPVEYQAADVITFQDGLVGFPNAHEVLLIQHSEGSAFRWMQSIDEPALAFLVVDPSEFVGNFEPSMPAADADALGMSAQSARLVYTIVTIPQGKPSELTLNLAGPIVVNAETGRARQVILEDDSYPIRYQVFRDGAEKAA
jgi:flagellar assembly factor FliW